jgi:hypothetical protein
MRHSNFYRRVWLHAVAKAGLPRIHFHDLRHTGNTLTEVSGVASAASFGGFGERALPAVQRAALEQARSHGSSCTLHDLGYHHPLASSRTMMQRVRLQQVPA